jgi:hypothetical protein
LRGLSSTSRRRRRRRLRRPPVALSRQLPQLRTLADQLQTLEGTGAAGMAATVTGVADVLHLLSGGEISVPA